MRDSREVHESQYCCSSPVSCPLVDILNTWLLEERQKVWPSTPYRTRGQLVSLAGERKQRPTTEVFLLQCHGAQNAGGQTWLSCSMKGGVTVLRTGSEENRHDRHYFTANWRHITKYFILEWILFIQHPPNRQFC